MKWMHRLIMKNIVRAEDNVKTCDTPCAIASLHIRRRPRSAHFESGARTSHKWLRLNFVKSNFAGWARGDGTGWNGVG